MTASKKAELPGAELKLRDFCDRIGANYRDARYALAHGIVPKGIERDPGRGNHRLFDHRQAFWLAIVLKLKAAGIKPKLAAVMASWAEKIKGFTVNSGWDWTYSPFDGKLATENEWILEVGDAEFVRILTDANPSRIGIHDASGWVHIKTRKLRQDAAPIVTIRVDLSKLSNQLCER
jgi:hypothetical protein